MRLDDFQGRKEPKKIHKMTHIRQVFDDFVNNCKKTIRFLSMLHWMKNYNRFEVDVFLGNIHQTNQRNMELKCSH